MPNTDTLNIPVLEDLASAHRGSFYTIAGAGGDLAEWVRGYEDLLAEQGIGKPSQWYQASGSQINDYARGGGDLHPQDAFKADLTFLLFPLGGLNAGKLAMFKIRMQDRWFDDMVENMRRTYSGVVDAS